MERYDGKKYEPKIIVDLVICGFGYLIPNNQITR